MSDLLADIRYAVRGLLARPAFSLTATLTLALGIGTTTAIFSVVNGVVLHDLPYPHDERLVTLCEQFPGSSPDWCSVSPPNVEDIAARSRAFESIGIGRTWPYHLAIDGRQQSVNGGIVTPGAFAALGARPMVGRLFEPADVIGAPSTVAVLSYETWTSRFGSDRGIVGRRIVLDDLPVTVVGVMQPGFTIPPFGAVDLWRPIHIRPTDEEARGWRGFVAYGLLREGTSLEAARAEIARVTGLLRREHFATTERWDIVARPVKDIVVGGIRPTLVLLLAAVVQVLLIGCANVANLLLVRAGARGREMAVRSALGATRGRIARASLVESLILGLAGAAGGVLLAMAGTTLFRALAPPGIPRIDEVRTDGVVLAFALGTGLAAALLFGVVPALRAARGDLARALREGGRASSRRGGRLSAVLVVLELALAVVLIAVAGLLTRTFAAYSAWQPGFERQHLLMFALSAPNVRYPTPEAVAALWTRVEGELATIPGAQSAGTASAGPLFGGDGESEIRLEGRATPAGASAAWFDVGPSWFGTLGIPVVRGRGIATTDAWGGARIALVNETFAARFLAGAEPVGQRFVMKDREMPLQIVGVVRDVPPLIPGKPPEPQVYWSNQQLPRPFTWVMVRTTLPPASLAAAITARLKSIDSDLEPGSMRPYSELISRQLTRPRFTMLLLVAFGGAALLLAAVGVYGLLAYVVSMRSREIAIRLALGAQRSQVLADVVARGFRLAALGSVVGVGAALALGRTLTTLVSGVSSRDPFTLAGSVVVLLAVAIGACLIPARRASRLDPAAVLSAE
jgi:predicted permease